MSTKLQLFSHHFVLCLKLWLFRIVNHRVERPVAGRLNVSQTDIWRVPRAETSHAEGILTKCHRVKGRQSECAAVFSRFWSWFVKEFPLFRFTHQENEEKKTVLKVNSIPNLGLNRLLKKVVTSDNKLNLLLKTRKFSQKLQQKPVSGVVS